MKVEMKSESKEIYISDGNSFMITKFSNQSSFRSAPQIRSAERNEMSRSYTPKKPRPCVYQTTKRRNMVLCLRHWSGMQEIYVQFQTSCLTLGKSPRSSSLKWEQ